MKTDPRSSPTRRAKIILKFIDKPKNSDQWRSEDKKIKFNVKPGNHRGGDRQDLFLQG